MTLPKSSQEKTKATVRIAGIFEVDGKEIELGKEYEENWVKTRGNKRTCL